MQGVNIDFEPLSDVHDPADNPTLQDGILFAAFLNALGEQLHALPGRRRQLSMDSESVAGACWSMSGANDNTTTPPGHPWNRLPCPWIRYFWSLDALAAGSPELDLIIPMDTCELPRSTIRLRACVPSSALNPRESPDLSAPCRHHKQHRVSVRPVALPEVLPGQPPRVGSVPDSHVDRRREWRIRSRKRDRSLGAVRRQPP